MDNQKFEIKLLSSDDFIAILDYFPHSYIWALVVDKKFYSSGWLTVSKNSDSPSTPEEVLNLCPRSKNFIFNINSNLDYIYKFIKQAPEDERNKIPLWFIEGYIIYQLKK